jgi:pantothenate kinase
MSRKSTKKKIEDTGSIIDSPKVLVIEGINLYLKLKPKLKRKPTRKLKNDNNHIQNN